MTINHFAPRVPLHRVADLQPPPVDHEVSGATRIERAINFMIGAGRGAGRGARGGDVEWGQAATSGLDT